MCSNIHMYNNLLSTKFLYAMGAMLIGYHFVLRGIVDAPAYFEFVKWIGTIYVIGNGVSSAIEKIPGKSIPDPVPPVNGDEK